MSRTTTRIKTITAWRGIFSIVVLLYHSEVHVMDWAVSLAVSFFLVASGFLTTVRHHGEFSALKPRQWWDFWWSRTCRLLPTYWAAMLLMLAMLVCFKHEQVPWRVIAAVATLTQQWVPDKAFYLGINGWFIGTLLFCYACYPLIDRWFTRLRLRWQVLAMVAIMAIFLWWLPQLNGWDRTYTYVCPATRLGDYLMGVVAGNIYLASSSRPSFGTLKATLIEAGSVLLSLEVIVIYSRTTLITVWGHYLDWWIPAVVIVFTCAMLCGSEGLIGRLLLIKPLQWLGGHSLEIYLLHKPLALVATYIAAPILAHYGVSWGYEHYVWIQLPLVLLAAWGARQLRLRLWPAKAKSAA